MNKKLNPNDLHTFIEKYRRSLPIEHYSKRIKSLQLSFSNSKKPLLNTDLAISITWLYLNLCEVLILNLSSFDDNEVNFFNRIFAENSVSRKNVNTLINSDFLSRIVQKYFQKLPSDKSVFITKSVDSALNDYLQLEGLYNSIKHGCRVRLLGETELKKRLSGQDYDNYSRANFDYSLEYLTRKTHTTKSGKTIDIFDPIFGFSALDILQKCKCILMLLSSICGKPYGFEIKVTKSQNCVANPDSPIFTLKY